MEELLSLLNGYSPLPPEAIISLMHRFSKETYRKNRRILEVGSVCDWIAFIERGLVKVYYEPENGSEFITAFYKEGDIVNPMKSLFEDIPSNLSFQVIDETHLRKIRKAELESICSKYPILNFHLLKILETKYSKVEDHRQILMEPVKNRVPLVKRQEPWLLEDPRIKDYMLAAYLGIDKATFSRLRNGKYAK